jgi:hypothetical protein
VVKLESKILSKETSSVATEPDVPPASPDNAVFTMPKLEVKLASMPSQTDGVNIASLPDEDVLTVSTTPEPDPLLDSASSQTRDEAQESNQVSFMRLIFVA